MQTDSLLPPPEARLTGPEAAEILGVSRDVINRLGRTGRLTKIQLPGTHPMYLRSEIEDLVRGAVIAKRTPTPATS